MRVRFAHRERERRRASHITHQVYNTTTPTPPQLLARRRTLASIDIHCVRRCAFFGCLGVNAVTLTMMTVVMMTVVMMTVGNREHERVTRALGERERARERAKGGNFGRVSRSKDDAVAISHNAHAFPRTMCVCVCVLLCGWYECVIYKWRTHDVGGRR